VNQKGRNSLVHLARDWGWFVVAIHARNDTAAAREWIVGVLAIVEVVDSPLMVDPAQVIGEVVDKICGGLERNACSWAAGWVFLALGGLQISNCKFRDPGGRETQGQAMRQRETRRIRKAGHCQPREGIVSCPQAASSPRINQASKAILFIRPLKWRHKPSSLLSAGGPW
jgi:hypothetical protein